MNIAILNLQGIDELNYTIDCLKFIDDEIIDPKIDIFTGYDFSEQIDTTHIQHLFPIDLQNITWNNFTFKYTHIRLYARLYKYNIVVDTECSFKSAIAAYCLSGRTAGFKKRGFKGYLISKFYDETIPYNTTKDKRELTFDLLKKVFGFENTYIIK